MSRSCLQCLMVTPAQYLCTSVWQEPVHCTASSLVLMSPAHRSHACLQILSSLISLSQEAYFSLNYRRWFYIVVLDLIVTNTSHCIQEINISSHNHLMHSDHSIIKPTPFSLSHKLHPNMCLISPKQTTMASVRI